MRALLMTLILAATAAGAGCLENGVSVDDVPSGDDAGDALMGMRSEVPWSLTGCRVVVALVPATADAVEAHLPGGFTAVSGEEAFGLPPAVSGEAVIGLETFDCDSGAGLDGSVDGLAYGAYFTAVTPPDEHAVADADIHLYKWDTLVPDAERREFLRERGLPALDGSTDLSGQEAAPPGHAFDVTLTLGDDVHRFTGTAGAPAEAFRQGFYFVEFTETADGMAAWHMPDNEAPDAVEGTGTVQLAPDSLPAEIVGAEVAQAFFASSTTVEFRNGTIRLP